MAKRSRITSWAAALAVAVLTFPVAGDDWQPPPENAERCQNNMARYNEITAQLTALKRMSVQDLTEARGKLTEVELVNAGSEALSVETKAMFAALSAKYGYNWAGCITQDMNACTAGLATHIKALIQEAEAAETKYNQLLSDRRQFDTNLIALGCVPPVFSVAGTYNSTWGSMTLTGESDVSGNYAYQGGRIQGTLTGTVLTGYWSQTQSGQKCTNSQLGSLYWGQVVLTFGRDARSFTGRWGYCDDAPGRTDWSGQK